VSTAPSPLAMRDGHARARQDRLAGWLAVAGASLGLLAGLLELTIGPSIRDWVGNKQDTTRLGLTTMLLSAVALAAAGALRGRSHRRVAIALGLLVPGLICFTTVGRLWYLPGALLLLAAALVVAGTPRHELASAIDERHWRNGLLALCGAYYILLGATALGVVGVVGIVCGLLVWTAIGVAPHSRSGAAVLLLVGALPFALLTWWSAVTPLIAIVTLVIGHRIVRRKPVAR
jgi:hypothetical protein